MIRHIIKRRHINAFNLDDFFQECLLVRTLLLHAVIESKHFHVDFFALAQYEKVKEIRNRFWITNARSSGKNKRR